MALKMPTSMKYGGLRCFSEASSGIHHFANARVSLNQSFDSLFDTIKSCYIEWRKNRGEGLHSFSVCAPVSAKNDDYKKLVYEFLHRWNSDQELIGLPPIKVEFCLEYRGNAWVGCNNSIAPMDLNVGPQMRYVDLDAELAEAEAAFKAHQEAANKQRRENSIRDPVALPRNIASEIARYLRLEYGESYAFKGGIKAKDLKLDCEVVINGVPTQFWRYPASQYGKSHWATVERFDDAYHIGMTTEGPPTVGAKSQAGTDPN